MKNRLFQLLFFSLSINGFCQEIDFQELLNESARLRAVSKYDSALIICQQVLSKTRQLDDYEYQSHAQLEMTSIYYSTQKYDFAFDAARGAIVSAQLANEKNLEMTSIYNLGLINSAIEQYDSAQFYYKKALDYFEVEGNESRLGQIFSGLAGLNRNKGSYIEAIKYDIKAAVLYKRTNQLRYLVNRFHDIGDSYLILDYQDSEDNIEYYRDSAEYYFLKSVELCDSLNFPDPKFWSLRGLAIISERNGDYERAYSYMNLSSNISQNFYSNDVEGRLLELREIYNTTNLELEAEQQRYRALQQEKNKNLVLIVSVALLIIFSIWLYILDQRRKSIKAIAAKNDELNKQRIDELLQQQEIASLQGVLEGQEQERKRVAIDLHDRLGGILSMVKLHFSAVEEKLPEENPEKKKFLTASELLDLAAGEVRNISHNLMSGVLAKFGLLPALKDLTDRINESGQIKLNLIHHNVEDALSGEQELQLYRIVQELISNILKHSDASEATIQLIKNEDVVNLIVEDDGRGFNPTAPSLSGGIGLNNLKVRVNKLEGTFHIDSGKGVGTTVSVDIPIQHD